MMQSHHPWEPKPSAGVSFGLAGYREWWALVAYRAAQWCREQCEVEGRAQVHVCVLQVFTSFCFQGARCISSSRSHSLLPPTSLHASTCLLGWSAPKACENKSGQAVLSRKQFMQWGAKSCVERGSTWSCCEARSLWQARSGYWSN